MLSEFATSAALGWLGRRALDWGGWLGTFLLGLIALYNKLPEDAQDSVSRVITGGWQEITLGSLVPLIGLIWSQVMSFKATVRDQVVVDGQKVTDKDLTESKTREVKKVVVPVIEKKAERKPTLLERLFTRERR